MSVTSIEQGDAQGISLPVDGLILRVARRFGGKSKEVERFLKFAMVGTLGAILDLGTSFVLLRTIFDPRIRWQFLFAATISFIVAVLSNFFWNRYWTYPDSRSRSLRRQLAQFAVVSVLGWGGRTIWLSLTQGLFSDAALELVHVVHFPIDDELAALIGGMIAIFIGIFVVMIWNFLVNRYWTYNDVDKKQEQSA